MSHDWMIIQLFLVSRIV